jgi:hypothetical protein
MKREGTTYPPCENCGGPLEPKRQFSKNPQKFCSDKCRSNFHNDRLRGYSKPLTEHKILKCPHCSTTSATPNLLEQIGPTQYLCNVCSKVSEITLQPTPQGSLKVNPKVKIDSV